MILKGELPYQRVTSATSSAVATRTSNKKTLKCRDSRTTKVGKQGRADSVKQYTTPLKTFSYNVKDM